MATESGSQSPPRDPGSARSTVRGTQALPGLRGTQALPVSDSFVRPTAKPMPQPSRFKLRPTAKAIFAHKERIERDRVKRIFASVQREEGDPHRLKLDKKYKKRVYKEWIRENGVELADKPDYLFHLPWDEFRAYLEQASGHSLSANETAASSHEEPGQSLTAGEPQLPWDEVDAYRDQGSGQSLTAIENAAPLQQDTGQSLTAGEVVDPLRAAYLDHPLLR